MNILALECSSPEGSVAILEDGRVVNAWDFPNPRGRGTELFLQLEAALRACDTLDLLVVGTGPGSYNGLRTGISAAWGVARAREARLAGVSSLLGYEPPEYFVIGDARADQRFVAHVVDGRFLRPPALVPPGDVKNILLPGIPVFTTSVLVDQPEAIVKAPHAGILGVREFVEGPPIPLYLKPPHITKPTI